MTDEAGKDGRELDVAMGKLAALVRRVEERGKEARGEFEREHRWAFRRLRLRRASLRLGKWALGVVTYGLSLLFMVAICWGAAHAFHRWTPLPEQAQQACVCECAGER